MTYDPREAKLPKWAQEHIADIRRRADLAWPTIPKPAPLCEMDGNGFAKTGEKPKSVTVYRLQSFRVKSVNIDQNGYERAKGAGFGTRMEGEYYATREDALAAAWWKACEVAASEIHSTAQAYREEAEK